jgi:hypothetical protein
MSHRQSAVNIRSEEHSTTSQVRESMAHLKVIDMEVQANEYTSHVRIQRAAVRYRCEIGGLDVPAQGWISAADVWHVLRGKLLLYARLA